MKRLLTCGAVVFFGFVLLTCGGALMLGSRAPAPVVPVAKPVAPAVPVAPAPSPYIPGLAAVDLHGNLTKRGFEYGGMQILGKSARWACKRTTTQAQWSAEALGDGPTKLSVINASYLHFGEGSADEPAGEFLAFVASLPYGGSDPPAAVRWVKANIGKNAATTIGGVRLELNANAPRARLLRIAREGQ